MLDFTYENFDDETKEYLNKAMDIYSTIKDKEINKKVKDYVEYKEYTFSKLDKKILSLFIASFYTPNLSNILDEYEDLQKRDLFDFINTKEEEIKKLEELEYSGFYDKCFKLELMSIIENFSSNINIRKITPEIIICSFDAIDVMGSKILDYFLKTYNTKKYFFDHPIAKTVKNYAILHGLLQKKPSSNKQNFKLPGVISLNSQLKEFLDIGEKPSENKEEKKIDLDSEELWSILDDIKAKFIGQEVAAEALFYNIVNNQDLASKDDALNGERSIIFLDGPTGTGKTAITREITEKLDIPFTATSIVNYSSTGYVGGNITDTLETLYKQASGNLEMAERGIIVFDEFDKLANSSENGLLEMKKAVQQQLLDFMGGGTYEIVVGDNLFNREKITFDTSKLTFICLAALTDLREKKTQKKQIIGFGNRAEAQNNESYTITVQDLIDIGLKKELAGRFNTFLHTEEYSKESLLRILKESTISPIAGFEKWITSHGKKLIIEDGVYEAIADAAYDLNTGARSLQTVMNNIRTPFLKKVLRGKEDTIYLDVDTVKKITEETVKRKVRK